MSSTHGHRTSRRALAVAAAVALLGAGCAYGRQVSNPAANPQHSGAYDKPSVSSDGRYVAYAADTDPAAPGIKAGVYVLDLAASTTQLVSVATDGTPANDLSSDPSISSDGRYVAFSSDADNLVANDTNTVTDVFVRDRVAGTTTRISITSAGAEVVDPSYQPSISADGRYAAFTSDSDDLDPVDSNGFTDVFVRDRVANTTKIMSVGTAGVQTDFGAWDGVLSGNGKFVAFTTDTGLVSTDQNNNNDVYRRDLTANTTRRISPSRSGAVAGGGGETPAISNDGNTVTFSSDAADLTAVGDTNGTWDIFVRDVAAATTTRVSSTTAGGSLNGISTQPSISSDGKRVSYVSTGNPSGTDTNGTVPDVFVRDRASGRTVLTSTTLLLEQLNAPSFAPALSGDGRYSTFISAGALTSTDTNGVPDVFLRAIDVPTISSSSPSGIARGTSKPVTITGKMFLPGAIVLAADGVKVTAGVAVVNSETSITVTLTVAANAPTGATALYVQNVGTGLGVNGGAIGRCTTCLTVT